MIIDPPPPTEIPDNHESKALYEPTDDEMKAIADIFDQPTKDPDITGLTKDEAEKASMKNRLQSAKDNKLTLFDYRTPYADLFEDVEKQKPTIEFSTYLTKAQEFLQKYGINLSFGTDTIPGAYDYNGAPLNQTKLEDPKTKKALVDMIETIGNLPVEFFKIAGLKKMVMIDLSNSNSIGGYANTDKKDTYYFDPRGLPNSRGFLHETYHLYDVNHAGKFNMMQDKGYRTLNPAQLYRGDNTDSLYNSNKPQNDGQYISDEAYLKSNLFKEIATAQSRGDTKTVQQLQQELDTKAAGIVVATEENSFKNAVEDKAELASWMLDHTFINEVLDPRKPFLRQKALFLLARLAHHSKLAYPDSDIIRFLAETRANPNNTSLISFN